MFHRRESMKKRNMSFIIGGVLLAAMIGGGVFMIMRRNMRHATLPAPRQYGDMMSHNPAQESRSELQREVNILDDAQNRAFPL